MEELSKKLTATERQSLLGKLPEDCLKYSINDLFKILEGISKNKIKLKDINDLLINVNENLDQYKEMKKGYPNVYVPTPLSYNPNLYSQFLKNYESLRTEENIKNNKIIQFCEDNELEYEITIKSR